MTSESISYLQNEVLMQVNKVIEDCLKQVMSQYLGRPAEPEDGKRVTIGTFPDDRPMLLAIDGHHVGTIKIEFNSSTITATFNPAK